MARDFDGTSSDRIDISDTADLNAQSNMTVMAWARFNAVASDGVLLSKTVFDGDSEQEGFIFFFDNSAPGGPDRISFFIKDSGGTDRVDSVAAEVADEWHHWAAVLDDADDEMRLYKDGVLVNTTTSVTRTPGTNTNVLRLGMDTEAGATRLHDGRLAHCCFNNIDLTVGEIRHAMAHGAVRHNLVFHLPILGTGSPERDWSGNGNHGTVTGTSQADHAPVGPYFAFDRGWPGAFTEGEQSFDLATPDAMARELVIRSY